MLGVCILPLSTIFLLDLFYSVVFFCFFSFYYRYYIELSTWVFAMFKNIFFRWCLPCFLRIIYNSNIYRVQQTFICVLGVSILSLSTIFLLDFITVLTVWYFTLFFILICDLWLNRFKKEKGYLEVVSRRWTENIMDKTKRTKGQTVIYNTLHRTPSCFKINSSFKIFLD